MRVFMQVKPPILGLLMCFTGPVYGQVDPLEGRMSCLVTGQNLMIVKDGKANQYDGFRDQVKLGDPIYIDYGLHFNLLKISLSDKKRNNQMVEAEVDIGSILTKVSEENGVFSISDLVGTTTIGDDFIMFKNSIFGEVSMHRYYKEDWQGLYLLTDRDFTGNKTLTTHSIAVDCRHGVNKLEELKTQILERISEK